MPEIEPQIIEVPVDPPAGDAGQEQEKKMPESPSPMELLQLESVGNIQANNTRARDAATLANNALQGAITRDFGELGTLESRAHSGAMATDVGGPTNAGK